MPTQVVYCIDASALIDVGRWYPEDVFDIWAELAKLVAEGRLIAPKEVMEELKKKEDIVLRWTKKHKTMFCVLDKGQISVAREIVQKFPDLIDPAKQIPDADPFVVALAVTKQRAKPTDDLFTSHEYVVVTQEKRRKPGAKPRIPDACDAYNITPIALVELFRREGWRFVSTAAERRLGRK